MWPLAATKALMSSRRRTFRVAERIQAVIANQLIKASDPRFELVTITSVAVSPDLRNAKVYWMVSGGKERVPEVQEAFESAAGLFKRSIGKDIGTRFVPELKFYYDDTLDTSEEVERLFDRIRDH